MPGQYASGNEVSPDGIVHLESISPDVVVVRRHGVSHRRLTFYGSDGRTRCFSIQGSISWLLGRSLIYLFLYYTWQQHAFEIVHAELYGLYIKSSF